MLKSATLCLRRFISVYEGISPALLATMSLSQGIRGHNNSDLINSLVKGSILHTRLLKEAMQDIDRKHFILPAQKTLNAYENKPYKISNGQCMTDIFTQAVMLQKVVQHIESLGGSNWRILDVGTGHGYMAYVMANYLTKSLGQGNLPKDSVIEIVGIDVGEEAIAFSQQLLQGQRWNFNSAINLIFKHQSLDDLLQSITQPEQGFDVVIGGFYLPPTLEKRVLAMAHRRSHFLGIWAGESQHGQSLATHTLTQEGKVKKEQIMETLFSMPVVNSAVSRYFVEEHEADEDSKQEDEETRSKLVGIERKRKQKMKESLKEELKQLIGKHSQLQNEKLSLERMRAIPEINQILEKLK